jgi:hypothetical protein
MALDLDSPARLNHPLIVREFNTTISNALTLCAILGKEGTVSIWDHTTFHRFRDGIDALAHQVSYHWPK